MRHARGIGVVAALVMVWCCGSAKAQVPQAATDAEVAEKVKAAGEADDYDGAERVVVLEESDCTVMPSGVAETITRRVVKLLKPAGVKTETIQRFDFDPDTTRITVVAVRVHRKGGEVVEVPLASMVQRPAAARMIYWGNEIKLLNMPRLEVGDAIDITTSKTGFNIAYLSPDGSDAAGETELIPPMPGHWYETVYFEGSLPIVEQRYTVRLPNDMPVQYEVYHGTVKSSLLFDGDHHVYSFSAKDVPAFKREPHMIAFSDAACKLVMATLEDWESKSRWFHGVNETQFEADEDIRAKVAELTAGLTTDDEKIGAMLHWVADDVRYIGTSRGRCEGYTLHRGTETFRDRGGVCKDKAGMLITMLRAAGYESYPVLTQAGSGVEFVPADQFNHTVTCLRKPDGSLTLLDPTWAPASREWWSSREPRQYVVYGLPEGKGLSQSPYFPPTANVFHATSEGQIGEDGSLELAIRWHDMEGYPDTYLRRSIGRTAKRDRRGMFESGLSRIAPNVLLKSYRHSEPLDYSGSASAEVSVSAAHYAIGDGAVMAFRLPLMRHPLAEVFVPDLLYELKDERKLGMRVRATRLAKYEETVRIPAGWRIDHVPVAKTLERDAARMSFEIETDGDGLHYRFEIAVHEQIIPPEQYAGYKEVIEAMNEISEDWIVCRKVDGATELVKKNGIDGKGGDHAVQ